MNEKEILNRIKIIALKRKGHSQKEIAEKVGLSQQNVSYILNKAKKNGSWNGEEGSKIEEEILEFDLADDELVELVEKEEKSKRKIPRGMKGYYKCTECYSPLTPLKEVTFKPSTFKDQLLKHGYNYVCTKCETVYMRTDVPDFLCPKCKTETIRIKDEGKFIGHLCLHCKLLHDPHGKIWKKKQTSSQQIQTAIEKVRN